MYRLVEFVCLCLILCIAIPLVADASAWQPVSGSMPLSEVRAILFDRQSEDTIYVATEDVLYKSTLQDESQPILKLSSQKSSINQIHAPHLEMNTLAVASNSGLYQSQDRGLSWDRIFSSSNLETRHCLSVLYMDEGIFLGTNKGIYFRAGFENKWKRIFTFINQPVLQLVRDLDYIYIMTTSRLYRLVGAESEPELIYQSDEINHDESSKADNWAGRSLRAIYAGSMGYVILAHRYGVSIGLDHGTRWRSIDLSSVDFRNVNAVIELNSDANRCRKDFSSCVKLLISTDKRLFYYNDGKLSSIYKGIPSSNISDLVQSTDGSILVATDKGIFRIDPDGIEASEMADLNKQIDYHRYFQHEPDIKSVHELVINYAEVHPQKIKNWRRRALKKAWLPSMDIGVDGGNSWSGSDSLWGTSSSGGTHYVGPDDKSTSENIGWDISLSWDLADLVWSTDQTTIDSRAKLMVELREDLLNQATRLYFERRRLQVEQIELPHDYSLQMRIAEITALIDALTGGDFSQMLTEKIEINTIK